MIFISINWLFVLIINVLGPRWIRGQPWLSVDVCWLSLCGLLIMIMRIGCWGGWLSGLVTVCCLGRSAPCKNFPLSLQRRKRDSSSYRGPTTMCLVIMMVMVMNKQGQNQDDEMLEIWLGRLYWLQKLQCHHTMTIMFKEISWMRRVDRSQPLFYFVPQNSHSQEVERQSSY